MTTATPPPPRDEEMCAALVAELDTFLGQWRTVGAIPFELAGIVDRYRPAAPSKPVAETQQDEERPHMTAVRLRPHYAPCDFPDHPCSCGAAEDRLTIAAHLAALAAQPSADTETLREQVKEAREQLSQRVLRYRHRYATHSDAGRADLAHVTQMVADAYADALHLLAAVDGDR